MAKIDTWYKTAIGLTLNGETRDTRSGEVISYWNGMDLKNYDLQRDGLPLLTCKRIPWKLVIGELLWFLSGKTDLASLRKYSGIAEGGKTIWTADAERWWNALGDDAEWVKAQESLGIIYGKQWREFGVGGIDQIQSLLDTIRDNPVSRYQMVTAYNPEVTAGNAGALPPCHTFFQTYVDNNDCLHLKWYQRSADMFLGLPFNIASYAILLKILARLTNKYEGTLSGTFGDMHIYTNHMDAVEITLENPEFKAPKINLPAFTTLEELLELTANDFEVYEYDNAGTVPAPLSVG